MKNCIIITLIVLASITSSCVEDFLERRIDTNYTQEQVFASYTTMRNFGIGIYSHLPDGFDRINGGTLAAATDDAAHSGRYNDIQKLGNGNWGAFGNPDDQWDGLYQGIRKANLFITHSENFRNVIVQDTVTEQGKQTYQTQSNDLMWLRAEAHFLKAYFYFELIKRYGGVPLIEDVLDTEQNYAISRASYSETVNLILDEINFSVDDLRDTWSGYDENRMIGRATKGAALALKSRVLLYAASPLNNPSNDYSKWTSAAEAAAEVIHLNRYSLFDNYATLFRSSNNNELIFTRQYEPSNNLERGHYPIGFTGATGGTNPSQNLVDTYETIAGMSVLEDPTYDQQNPYQDRDPRLMMSIIVNGTDYKGRPIQTWEGGLDGPDRPRGSKTGYYQKKYIDEGLDLLQNRTSVHTWIYFRYAEILLNYAEAMNEVYGPDGIAENTPVSAREALNMVRQRPGVNMPEVTENSKEIFRERIRNERRVELAFEEHRFWDTRRWMIAEHTLGQPVRGVLISKEPDGSLVYSYRNIEHRVFQPKMYLYPIAAEEINRTSGRLDQNPGW